MTEGSEEAEERPNPAKLCFACGEENPRGLHMHFRMESDKAIAEFTIPEYLQGFPGQAHGGVVATMLDEAMGWATYGRVVWTMPESRAAVPHRPP